MGVDVVPKDKDFVFKALQIVAPSLKGFNNSQELIIMSLVANLGGDHFLKEKGY